MKRFLFFVALVAVAVTVYMLTYEGPPPEAPSGELRSSRTPSATASSAPTAVATRPSGRPTPPVYTARPTPRSTVVRPRPPTPPSFTDSRSAEIRKIIFQCARRAGWQILDYRQPRYGVSEVTGWTPSGDHVRAIRFLDEVERSGIIVDINGGRRARPARGRDGRQGIASTITIKWR